MKTSCDMPLIVRGDLVGFEMKGGKLAEVWLPGDWGLLHDPLGECIPRCTLFIAPYRVSGNKPRNVPDEVVEAAEDYFGSQLPLYDAELVIPSGPWDRVGRVVRIFYDRYGNLKGPYQHPFKQAVTLSRQRRAQVYPGGQRARAYRLSLPDGCVINAHGFVSP